MKIRLFFLFLVISSGSFAAEKALFSIQIAATKSHSLAFFKRTTNYDTLYADDRGSGLIKIKLGSYGSHEAATKHLTKIRKNGFPDAFITPYTKKIRINSDYKKSFSTDSRTKTSIVKERLDPKLTSAWPKLTAVQKQNIVYVDGELHLHEGDKFIPLAGY